MTLKEFAIKVGYDNAGMTKFKEDCEQASMIAKHMGTTIGEAAQVMDRTVTTGVNHAGQSFRDVTTIFNQNGKNISVTFRDVGNAVQLSSLQMREGASTLKTLGTSLEQVGARALLVAPAWMALRFAISSVIQLFQQSVSFMVEWETQMARISLVTQATNEQIDVLSHSLLGLSEKFGISNKDVSENANLWLRMGANLNTVVPLLEATAKLSLISGKNMEDSSKSINSLISAFGLNAGQASDAIDKLIGIEQKSGVSLEVLFEGFSKAGVKAQQSGISINQLAGYIAAVNEKTRQSGELIGTQLASMFTRLGTTGIQASQALSGVNFYLDATGKQTNIATPNLRKMNDIITELASNWKNLSTVQQDALAKALGGNLRATTVIALLDNFNAAVKASGTSVAEGEKDLAKVQGTVENQIKQLQGAWGRFIDSVANTGVMQTVLNNIKQRVDLITMGINGAHAAWDFLFNRAEFDKKIAAFKELQEAQKNASKVPGAAGATPNAPETKELSSSYTEATIKAKIQAIEEKALLTRQDALKTVKEELAVLGDGITSDGKNLTNQVYALNLKKEKLEVDKELADLAENQTVIEARLKDEGASQLQIDIAHLAYLQQTHASLQEIENAQKKVTIAAGNEYKAIQNDIIDALVGQQKTLGETAIQQVQHKIALEDQLGIHLQGIDLLKQQLELYKAINAQASKTPLERAKELKDLIKKTHGPEEYKETESTKNLDEQLIRQARKKGISDETIDSILHPNTSSVDRGGANSLQTILQNSLTDPLNRNITDLTGIIKLLAEAISRPSVGPNLTSNQRFRNPETPIVTAAQGQSVPSYALPFRGKDVTVDLGGINVTVHAHNKTELKNELTGIMQEMIANHMVRPDSKMNQAIKKVVDAF